MDPLSSQCKASFKISCERLDKNAHSFHDRRLRILRDEWFCKRFEDIECEKALKKAQSCFKGRFHRPPQFRDVKIIHKEKIFSSDALNDQDFEQALQERIGNIREKTLSPPSP